MTTDHSRASGGIEDRERAKRASPPERSAAVRQASDGVGGFAGAKPPEMDDDVALLVRLAGTSDAIAPLDEDRLARVRTTVHGAWREECVACLVKTRRRWLTVAVLLAVASSVVVAVAIWRPIRTPVPVRVPVLVAHIDQTSGSSTQFTTGGAVMSGSTISTSAGTLAMTLTSAVRLRMDAASTVRLDSATDIVLEGGAIYVDSADAHPTQAGASPISVHTPAGLVRDIGTQFEVRLAGTGMRIRVRNGQVRITQANGVDARGDAGEELFARADGSDRSISRHAIAATGSEWAWAERAAPAFSIKGKTLGAFLDWVSREGAWTVTFADSRSSAAERAIVLDGRPDLLKGLTPAEALDVVLLTCGLRYRIDHNRVVIEKEIK